MKTQHWEVLIINNMCTSAAQAYSPLNTMHNALFPKWICESDMWSYSFVGTDLLLIIIHEFMSWEKHRPDS